MKLRRRFERLMDRVLWEEKLGYPIWEEAAVFYALSCGIAPVLALMPFALFVPLAVLPLIIIITLACSVPYAVCIWILINEKE